IGDTLLVREPNGDLAGFALYHTAALAAGRSQDEVRILKLVARHMDAFDRLLAATEAVALGMDIRRLSLRCQTAQAEAYLRLIRQGFRTHWTDLRMTLATHPEQGLAEGAVVFSNWEI